MANFIEEIKLFTDGGCRNNPGPGAIGVLILDGAGNQELFRHAECIGHTTNNRAEYRALIKGLDLCAKHTRGRVYCFVDSELIVNHMNGVWRLKNDELRELYHEVKKKEQVFREVVYQHVKRENPYMKKVDRLVNEAFEGR
jgi:ribonuclease HI